MDYTLLNQITTAEDRELLMKFLELPPQKLMVFTTAIISSFLKTFEKEESRKVVLEAMFDTITKDLDNKAVELVCSFCNKHFYANQSSIKDGDHICPQCVFPDLTNKW